MPNGDDNAVLFKSPRTGKVQPVPQESWDDQLAAGYTPVSHKVMYSTSGQRSMVPNEELRDYIKQGYQTTPKTQFEQNVTGTGDTTGAGTAFVNTLKGMIPPDPTGGAPILSKKFWMGNGPSFNPSQGGIAQIGKEAQAEYQRSRAAGSGPVAAGISAGVAGAASPLGVSNIQQMGQAEKGETGQILGESAAPATVAAAGPLIGKALGKLSTTTPPPVPGTGISPEAAGAIGRSIGEKTKIPFGGWAGEKIGRKFGTAGATAESEADIQAGLQQRRAAYAEMNEDFANRAKQQAADMQKKIAASEKRISAAEDARQKEITDWAKVDKINEADHQAFQDRMAEIEQERQKALADTEKLRTQHAQDLQQRGTQQAAMDAAHAQSLADIEKARQGDLAAQERLKLQHAEALNRRKGAKAPPAPPPNPFAGMTSTAPSTSLGNAPLPPAGPAPATIRMGTGIGAEQLATQQVPVSRQGMTPPPTPMPEPEGAPLSRPTVGSQIAARNKTSILERGRTLYQPGEEPDLNNPVHAKIINDLQTRSGPALRTMAKNGDRFAAFVLRNMPRP